MPTGIVDHDERLFAFTAEIDHCESLARAERRLRPAPFVIRFIMDLEVKFDGEEIIVTKPGTDFMLAYRKRPHSPNLVLTRSWVDPHTTSPAVSEFRAQAFQAAVSKARELGWSV